MANMYAADFKDVLPGAGLYPLGAGGNPWDVGIGFTTNVASYGLTVPMWFCPVRAGGNCRPVCGGEECSRARLEHY